MLPPRRGALSLIGMVILCGATGFALQSPSARTVKLPDGTVLRLALLDVLSSATNNVDDPVNFEVTEDVKVGDLVVLPKGTSARGHVVEAVPRKRMGRAGKLNFSVDSAKGPDGSNIRLRATSARQGEDKSGTVIVGTLLLSPLFLIMRGKDVSIPKGTQFTAYVDGDRDIAMGGPAPAAPPAAAAAQPSAGVMAEDLTTAVLKSEPAGADATVDGKYMGSTPSSVRLSPGDHTILLEKVGYKAWQRTMTVSPGGIVTIDATLVKSE